MYTSRLRLSASRIKEIRRIASRIIAQCKIDAPPIPIELVARSLGADVRYGPYEDGDLAGMLVRKGDRSLIGVNSSHHQHRQRFTIAHECGHLLLHSDGVFIDRHFEVFKRDATSSEGKNVEEIEANQCAADLLMPAKMLIADIRGRPIDLEDDTQVSELAKRYRVSMLAMSYRLANVLM
ncbi:ImmA/IrrE family metallo-endopeptidase [Pelagibacterium luteolum]|uniref:IrrE N-terminal-like domain-containing protein n=1 Tax=Pelagibacterium luteolum TaxID=440168 RepID=A0A1G7VDN7_9HYPH|nr:ImmA/IrrE family metallo-endopeptidase [Pelagibacterium luteolum]SDG57926.1 protein of unknown function [Pelagibacterium luteolum]